MDMLKKIWPTPFKIGEKDIVSLVINLVIFIVVCGLVGWLISKIPGIIGLNILLWAVGLALEVYGFVGIVLSVLKFLGLIK